jgi:acyl-[acyl-carrier-protein]-phospholipid O-acyltransferase/long-chain-fatty-acid--[acyl-carrier-protein] ligase
MNETKNHTRGFWALIVTQFQGAFSDNVVKNLVVFVAIFGTSMTLAQKNSYGESIAALFALPFILFSMIGGFLADRFRKRSVMLGVKIFELFIMSLVFVGLWTWNKNLLLAGVFLMGTHSAIFGPSKYGSLPELLPDKKLSWGNGILELGTFMAIILGTVAAAFMSQAFHSKQWLSGFILIALAVLGFFFCLGITKIPAANPQKKFNANIPAEIWRQLRAASKDRPLTLAFIANTYFNFLGMLLLLNLFFYGSEILHVDETHIGFLNVALALGIGLGSLAAGFLSGKQIEFGLVPIGAVGLSIFSALLASPHAGLKISLALLALLGFFGGFFIVPVAAFLQHKPARENKGEVQALMNWLSFVGVFIASGAHWLFAQKLQLTPRQIFLAGGLLTLLGAIYAFVLLFADVVRFAFRLTARIFYRVRVTGHENIPATGGALLVCNHVSFADGVFVGVACERPIRFLLFKEIYERWYIRPLTPAFRAIPISSEQSPRELIKSIEVAREFLRAGQLVCIFAEGQITRNSQLLPFQRGFERIVKGTGAPIIPVALSGVIGSLSSFKNGKSVTHVAKIPQPLRVSFGKPMPTHSKPEEVREAVRSLLADAAQMDRDRFEILPRAFVRTCRKNSRRFAMADTQNSFVNFSTLLTKTIFLARRLKKVWRDQNMVGIFLPPGVAGALVNHAAFLCGKVPVNLNYTLSPETIANCARQCEIKTVVTSRLFLEKIKLTPPGELIFLEDFAVSPKVSEKLFAFVAARFFPFKSLARIFGCAQTNLDSLATIIFSSGSTGEPKGVMLSHFNLAANIAQMEQILIFNRDERILGILPFFHSFGFAVTLCLPAVTGTGVVFYPNPLDARAIGMLVRDHRVTLLLATPTFLQIYTRAILPENFGSLKLVITGAEKLPENVASAFEKHFGIRPLEGYGSTECSPAVAVNVPNFRAAGFCQIGNRPGKIGMPLPGMAVKIADAENPWSEKIIPPGEPGMLLVRGPNIMRGYLGQPEKTAEVLRDGWYCTGDIATLDDEGFLQITGRLSRFSKIGGEMVPHLKIEEKLHELAGVSEQTFFVTGVPDEKKGERLVVLHKLSEKDLPTLLEKFANADLPNLWKPRGDAFFRVENFPLLGTGKLDLRATKEMAVKFSNLHE